MNIEFIPFKIGEQYENWEFDLEPFETTKTYDRYQYFKSDQKKLFSIPIEKILLTFSLDILFQVEYQFSPNCFEPLKSKLIEILTKGIFREYENKLEFENEKVCVNLEKSKITVLKITDKNYVNYLL